MLKSELLIVYSVLICLTYVFLISAQQPNYVGRTPMKENFENSLRYIWLNKKVHDSRILHAMEDTTGWSVQGIGRMELTHERAIDGTASLRFQTQLRDEERIKRNPGRRMMGSTELILRFPEPQDWSAYNRIALWVYVHPSDVRVHTFYLRFTCLNAPTEITAPKYASVIQNLTPGEWNYTLWEIPNLRRDRVTEFKIAKLTTGHDASENGLVTYNFDRLELQRVDAEKYEGWEIAPGKLSYNHVGYTTGQPKIALAGDLTASLFQVKDDKTGSVVLTKPVESTTTKRGTFQVLDFSEIHKPGRYFIWAGDRTSRPFTISDTLWLNSVRKVLNFYYMQRCGFDVPGVHPACHRDLQGIHNGQKKLINGGWHDAGDLSQGSFRTDMSVYAMLQLRQQLKDRNIEPALQERLLEEALWGMEWLLKTRFGDGYRITWCGLSIYTDGIIGTIDDVVKKAQNNPWENFIAAGVEALAGQVLHENYPQLAERSLQAAKEDWQAAVDMQPQWLDSGKVVLTGDGIIDNFVPFYHRWFSGGTYLTLSWGILSSVHLYQITGEQHYADRAIEYGRLLLACQETEFLDGIPLTGYFYTSPRKEAIVNHRHAAFEESPLLALRALCESFPGHQDWIKWYGAAVLHSEYLLKRGAEFSYPYYALANAVFRKSDILNVPDPDRREAMLRQLLEGTRLTDEYYLRFFPIWSTNTHHGNTTGQLSQTLALVAAAQLRNDLSCENLAAKQLQWVFGGNPFSQSMMYGEGYDYPPLYAYNPGDIVGALPVGMDCVSNDQPYWSASNHATFKEIWVVPVSRFLWNTVYLGQPALVRGRLMNSPKDTLIFYNCNSGICNAIPLDRTNNFDTQLPAGEYEVRFDSVSRKLTLLSGRSYELKIDIRDHVDFVAIIKRIDKEQNRIRIEVIAKGEGNHTFSILLFNGKVTNPEKSINVGLGKQSKFFWDVALTNPNSPWVAVIVPDGDFTWKKELTGRL